MMEVIKKSISVVKSDGFISFYERAMKNIISSFKRHLYNKYRNDKNWEALKGSYKGKRVFLIGNGPSLNITPLYYLKDEYTMCFNRFNIMQERISWLPTFYMVVDSLVARTNSAEINEIVNKVDYAFFPDIHKNGVVFKKFIEEKENILWFYPSFEKFSRNLPKIGSGGSVIYEGLQVLMHLGFSEIILIGVDMNYAIHKNTLNINEEKVNSKNAIESKQDDDPNHFDPRYFGKGKKYHQPEKYIIDSIMEGLKYAQVEFSKSETRIINAGYNSSVPFFPKKDFNNLFLFTEKEKERLFSETVREVAGYNNVEALIQNSIWVETYKNEFSTENKNYYTNVDSGIVILKKFVFSHIPLGPYKNMYFFVKRKS